MANDVIGKVTGGRPQTFSDVSTVEDVFEMLGLDGNYTAMVNGEPAEFTEYVTDYSQVHFSENIKGGL